MMLAKFGCMARLQRERVGPFCSRSRMTTRRRRFIRPSTSRLLRCAGSGGARGCQEPARLARVRVLVLEEVGLGHLLAGSGRRGIGREVPCHQRALQLPEADLGGVLIPDASRAE